jgi:hypothetical protein
MVAAGMGVGVEGEVGEGGEGEMEGEDRTLWASHAALLMGLSMAEQSTEAGLPRWKKGKEKRDSPAKSGHSYTQCSTGVRGAVSGDSWPNVSPTSANM